MKWLCDYGLIAPGNSIIYPDDLVTAQEVKIQLDRFHAYIGTSAKDDFYMTTNHDFFYENEEVPDVGPTGSAYYSNLIPESKILQWAKSQFDVNPDAKAFYETFTDVANREDGTIGGLVTDLNTLLQASDISAFIAALKNMALTRGYCPLWSSVSLDNQTNVNGQTEDIMILRVTTYDGNFSASEVRKGSRGYNESISRFTPIFEECLGISNAAAKQYATAYTDFKYDYATKRASHRNYEGVSVMAEEGEIFGDQTKGLNLYQFLKDIGINKPEYFVFTNGASVMAYYELFDDAHLDELKGVCIWQMLEHFISALPNKPNTMEWAHASSEAVHDATTLASDDFFEEYVIPNISGNLANVYYKSEEFKADSDKIYLLMDDIKTKFATRVSSSSWLSAQSKEKIKVKLDELIPFVSSAAKGDEPYNWVAPDYLGLEENGTVYINLTRKEKATIDRYGPLIGTKWDANNRKDMITEVMLEYDPLFANAFYVPWENGIVLSLGYMAAYKRPSLMTDEEFLASYGWVVGHEISHGFDATGISYDENGKRPYGGWLPSTDVKAFDSLAQNVSSYYSTYEVMPGQLTSGSVVLSEAIADITGLSIALDLSKDKEGFSYGDFFKNAAVNFGAYASQAVYASQLASDEHPFGRARVNPAFAAMDEFYVTFDVKESDAMYVAPANRPRIW